MRRRGRDEGTNWYDMTPTVCSGVSVVGYCWHAGAAAESCDTACAQYGGCNLTGTKNDAGSSGSDANCESVLAALSLRPGSVSDVDYGELDPLPR